VAVLDSDSNKDQRSASKCKRTKVQQFALKGMSKGNNVTLLPLSNPVRNTKK